MSGYIDESFFKEEIRDGFTVTVNRKKIWACELEILLEFDRICKKHGLRYFLESGTLIGAVRNHGFIPWDDDIDIQMFREDYEKAKVICMEELEHPLYWQDMYTILGEQDRYDDSVFRLLPFGKIRNADTAAIEEPRAPLSMNQGIFIDIFPLDDAMDHKQFTPEMYELQKELYYTVFTENELKRILESGDHRTVIPVEDLNNILKLPLIEKFGMFEKMLMAYSGRSTLVNHKYYEIRGGANLKKEWFDETAYMPFEGFELPVPGNWDAVLKTWFGDYMTPVRYPSHSMAVLDADRSYRDYYSEDGVYTGPKETGGSL